MRITKTADGRYIKTLSPELQGLIGRLYQEVRERRESDTRQDGLISNQGTTLSILQSKLEMLLIRYTDLSEALQDMFPEDEDVALIQRPLVVTNTVTALQFVSDTVVAPPLVVKSSMLVDNLNAKFIEGKSINDFAPITHVGAGGSTEHPSATQLLSGFMSTTDKSKLDSMSIGKTAPANPQPNHIWFDLSD